MLLHANEKATIPEGSLPLVGQGLTGMRVPSFWNTFSAHGRSVLEAEQKEQEVEGKERHGFADACQHTRNCSH